MTVGIQGERSGCVAQILLNRLHIVTGFQRNHCVRVAQIVESDILHIQFRHNQFECPVQSLGCYPVRVRSCYLYMSNKASKKNI